MIYDDIDNLWYIQTTLFCVLTIVFPSQLLLQGKWSEGTCCSQQEPCLPQVPPLWGDQTTFSLVHPCLSGRRPQRPRKPECPVHNQGDQHQERDKESDVPQWQGQQGPANGNHPRGHPGPHPRGYQREVFKVQEGYRGEASEALICFKPLLKEATYNEKLPELSRKQRDAIKREKGNSTEEVLIFFCKFSF